MDIFSIIVFGILGMAIGSFLNVVIDRLPAGKSLMYPPSGCDACQHRLSWLDLFPVFSYLFLRGRCRYCQAKIPQRVFWVELGTGLLTAFLFWHFGWKPMLALSIVYSSVLIALAIIDLKHQLILNKIVYPVSFIVFIYGYYGLTWQLALFGFYICALFILILTDIKDNFTRNLIIFTGIAIAVTMDIFIPGHGSFNGLLGGAVGFLILFLPALIYNKGMGWGDVKMAGLIGLMTGFPNAIVAVFGGIILGGLTAIVLLLFKKKNRKQGIPFGPCLALATIITFLWGSNIIHWYLSLFNL